MYSNYFGLKELPFSIAPNPDFLFMSDRHREALSHLTYGLGDTGGFVLLTGEVGTGKTTVSRCVLQSLPENTQVAFILNPTLSSHELLATVCDELKIKYRKTGATLKTLTDKIQEKLIKNHEAGLNTVLIIDEAQHLQAEVLEQLRLLTNLETNVKKLLQVILIGQPELQQLLQRQDLRQLAQRITARYHLMPLNKEEVAQYIKHRLDVAQSPRELFDKKALVTIHKLSNGIPRLINLLCDRALLKAYNSNQTLVNKKIVLDASEEALGTGKHDTALSHQASYQGANSSQAMMKMMLVAIVSVSVLIGAALFTGIWFANQRAVNSLEIEQPTPKQATVEQSIPVSEEVIETELDNTEETQEIATNESKLVEQADTEALLEQKLETLLDLKIKEQQLKEKTIKEEKAAIAQEAKKAKKIVQPEVQPINGEPKPLPEFKVEAEEGVSDELLTLFQAAIEETKRLDDEDLDNAYNPTIEEKNVDVRALNDMPSWVQNGVPRLNFQMHLYESDGNGSVRVNDRVKFVGDNITDDLKVIAIERNQVVLSYQNELFSLPSLSTWE